MIDITHTPFSRFGSYLAVSDLPAKGEIPGGIWLRNVHGDAARELFRLEVLVDGTPAPCTVLATPGELTLVTEQGRVRLCIAGENLVRVRGDGVGVRLTARPGAYNCAIPQADGRWLLNMATAFQNYLLHPLLGEARVEAPWGIARCEHVIIDLLPDATGVMEIALEQGVGTWDAQTFAPGFEAAAAEAAAAFEAFAAPYLQGAGEHREMVRAAAYLNWSTIVAPCGFFTRPAMLMSKNHMTNVWSWDHAFNALALSPHHPELAWDQLMVIFDHQLPNGQLPDFINDVVRLFNFVKPPIHGWIFHAMMAQNPWFADRARLEELYPKLCRVTDWWFAHRNPDGDGLPQYHHGNDSGWDNGTVFDVGLPVKGADLAAFLVVQMDVLAGMAGQLGRPQDVGRWTGRADALLERLLDRLWHGDHFVCPSALDGRSTAASDSIFGCLPLVLGDRLPIEIREALAGQVRRHLTEWGLATEHPDSPLYKTDGYWRGPIWAPPTLIIADGLRRAGEIELADEIARRFCRLCAQGGFAENFDPLTGQPQCDKAYTWTSSVLLVLAESLCRDETRAPHTHLLSSP
jgi:putative isomerase